MKDFMKLAINEALAGMDNNEGGPFGAVIIKDGNIISSAHNEVLKTNDPTAHAEILAIRSASQVLGRFNLSDCSIYTTCEPCPMCLSAIMWARIGTVIFGCTKEDAQKIGFDDNYIYEYIKGNKDHMEVNMIKKYDKYCLSLFECWENKDNKTRY